MKTRICIAGATGWTGRSLVAAIEKSDDLELVGAVARSHANVKLSSVVESQSNCLISGSIEEALKTPTDVLIDYTQPDIAKHNVMKAITAGIHSVIGTSGLTDADYEEIDRAARQNKVGVLAAGNFSISAVLMKEFAKIAAKHIGQWEIIEYGTPGKVDAPGGTGREVAFQLSKIRKPFIQNPIEKTQGLREARGASVNGTQIHSIRLPGFISATEVIFGAPGQRLRITQDSGDSAEPYVAGTLLAARKVASFVGLVRGLENILEL